MDFLDNSLKVGLKDPIKFTKHCTEYAWYKITTNSNSLRLVMVTLKVKKRNKLVVQVRVKKCNFCHNFRSKPANIESYIISNIYREDSNLENICLQIS